MTSKHVPLALLGLLVGQSLLKQFHIRVFQNDQVVLEHELWSFEEVWPEETVMLVIIALFSRQFDFLNEFRSVQAHHTKDPLLGLRLAILAKHNILCGFWVLFSYLELELRLLLVKFDEEVALQPVAQLGARWFIDAQGVAHVGLTHTFLSINLEVADPGTALALYYLPMVICVSKPV